MAVTALTPGTGTTATLTVTRGANSTTAATHLASASVYLVSDERGDLLPYSSSAVVDMGAVENTAGPGVASISPAVRFALGRHHGHHHRRRLHRATAVSFGSTAATSFTVVSATQITAVAPAESAGHGQRHRDHAVRDFGNVGERSIHLRHVRPGRHQHQQQRHRHRQPALVRGPGRRLHQQRRHHLRPGRLHQCHDHHPGQHAGPEQHRVFHHHRRQRRPGPSPSAAATRASA